MIKLIGYGNPGRGDDGLGPAFAEVIAAAELPGLSVRIDYQLSVEHALWIADAECVVFVDAMIDDGTPYRFMPAHPATAGGVTSHALSPGSVLGLTRTLYGQTPVASLLGISGVQFGDVREGLSPEAEANLNAAVRFFRGWLGDLPLDRPLTAEPS